MRAFIVAAVVLATPLLVLGQTPGQELDPLGSVAPAAETAAGPGSTELAELPPFPVLPGAHRSPVSTGAQGNAAAPTRNPTDRRSIPVAGTLTDPGILRSPEGPVPGGNPQSPVPEPETVVLFTMGLAGLGYLLWKRGLLTSLRFARQSS